jgi:hypothetical protein
MSVSVARCAHAAVVYRVWSQCRLCKHPPLAEAAKVLLLLSARALSCLYRAHACWWMHVRDRHAATNCSLCAHCICILGFQQTLIAQGTGLAGSWLRGCSTCGWCVCVRWGGGVDGRDSSGCCQRAPMCCRAACCAGVWSIVALACMCLAACVHTPACPPPPCQLPQSASHVLLVVIRRT